ncbi:MAG: ATP-binding cassette domain-containing protein [Acetobacteraceae bacterium]|nr:ATP-binding cassette domain-containing protein [Acetobacteraceae bacterium]
MLRVEGLRSAYGRIEAIKGVDLEVRAGEIVALIGANGAGKTTLLRAISGVQPISAGAILFEGERIEALPPHARVARGIAQVPEGRQVFGPLSVEDNLRLGAFRRGGEHAARGARRGLCLVSGAGREASAGGGRAVGRTAADARHRPGVDEPPAPPLAG